MFLVADVARTVWRGEDRSGPTSVGVGSFWRVLERRGSSHRLVEFVPWSEWHEFVCALDKWTMQVTAWVAGELRGSGGRLGSKSRTMRKRERENPCFVCGHYHKFEDGEVCGICGHRLQEATEKGPQQSAFSTEILPQFLYLGSYDNASRAELLKAQNITRILNTVPTCQNLYKNSFTYHSLKEDKTLPFSECLEFIEQARVDKARVLVHCMSGQSRSPAVVIAYLMRYKQWRLPQAYQWVTDRRPSINLTQAVGQQLQLFESEVFGNNVPSTPIINTSAGSVTFGFGYSAPSPHAMIPTFAPHPMARPQGQAPLFGSVGLPVIPDSSFVFSAAKHEPRAAMDHSMDSS